MVYLLDGRKSSKAEKPVRLALPLYGKLSLLITGFALASLIGFAYLALWSSDHYHQEVTQRLHRGLASYVIDQQKKSLISASGEVNRKGLRSIAENTMMINPAVEVYLLDPLGNILGHALPEASVSPGQIDLAPVREFLNRQQRGLVLGENPRNPSEPGIFSVAPLFLNEQVAGYLYIVLASYKANSLSEQLAASHITRLTIGAVIAIALFLGISGLVSFMVITRPLSRLTSNVRAYRERRLSGQASTSFAPRDEIAELEHSFGLMKERIQQQFNQIKESERHRKELISNVSHDLRTPLSSMQGYLETLLIKFNALTPVKQQQYLRTALRHSKQMATLVGQLFELSKLDSGQIKLNPEVFPLAELLIDIKQDYELPALEKKVALAVAAPQTKVRVKADIALIQRALQNLLDNAIRFTPGGGSICLLFYQQGDQVRIVVRDTGNGISAEDLPFVFDRCYRAGPAKTKFDSGGAGLGLSIVKRILDLHGSVIEVESLPNEGTSFSFLLPGVT